MNNQQKIIGIGVLFLGIILAAGISYFYQSVDVEDRVGYVSEKEEGNILTVDWENTPSQNLAIMEGRYEYAKKSIEETNG